MNKKHEKLIRKLLIIIILAILTFVFCCVIKETPSFADSGFDTSYDSGGSSGGSDSYSGGDGDGGWGEIIATLVICVVIFIAIKIHDENEKKKEIQEYNDSVIENKAKQLIPGFNKKQFLDDRYVMFCQIEFAKMSNNLETIRHLVNDEVYAILESELVVSKVNEKQNELNKFTVYKHYLKNAVKEIDGITITTGFIIERSINGIKMKQKYIMKYKQSTNDSSKKWMLIDKRLEKEYY